MILHFPYCIIDIAQLLQWCQKLKFLQFESRDCLNKHPPSAPPVIDISLPLLNAFIGDYCNDDFTQKVHTDILVSASNLQVYRGQLLLKTWNDIEARCSVEVIFTKLVALQLTRISSAILEKLANLDVFQLRYFRMEQLVLPVRRQLDKNVIQQKFRQLLSRMPNLETLILGERSGIASIAIEAVMKVGIPLKSGAFWLELDYRIQHYDEREYRSNSTHTDMDFIKQFQIMLLDRTPDICLSDIALIIEQEDMKQALDSANTELNIIQMFGNEEKELSKHCALNHPTMRRRLNLNF